MNHLQFRFRRGGWTRPDWEELRLQDISWWGNSKQAYHGGLGESGGKRIAGQEPGAGVRHGSVGDAGPADDVRQLVRGAAEEDGTHLLGAFGITRSAHCAFVKP